LRRTESAAFWIAPRRLRLCWQRQSANARSRWASASGRERSLRPPFAAVQPWDGPLDCRLAVARQHLRLDPRHRPGTHANLRGNLVLALVTLSDGLANGCLDPSAHTRATEFRPAGPCPGQPSVDAVDDHVPLELREGTRDGEQELTLGC